MARPKKVDLIKMLEAQGKEFDPDINYNYLYAMLDEGTVFPDTTSPEPEIPLPKVTKEEEIEVKDGENTLYTVTKSILERATKKVGLTVDRLKGFTSRQALVDALNKIHPASNPDAKSKAGKAPAYSQHKPMEDKFEIESKMEAKFISQNRAQFDEGKLQEELRRINRVHGPGKPVKIVKTSTFKPVNGVNKKKHAVKYLVTKYTIYMK